MKCPTFLAFAGLAVAQLASLPTCAQSCASKYLASGIDNCGSDPKCICSDSSFISGIACCLAEAGGCDSADQTSAVAYASQICAAQGVSVPSAVVCTSLASSGTAGTAGTAATATTAATSAGTTAVMSTGAATATTATTGAMTATASASSAKTSSAKTSASSASTAKTTTTASGTANWAPQQTAALGGVMIGGLVAALALL